MPSSILSQGEIDALLQGTGSQPRSDALLDALRRAFFSALDQLITSFDEPEMNGPYVERLEHSLAQEVAPAAFVVAAELGGRDLLLLVSTPDAERLAEELGIAPLTMMEAMGQAWVSQLAQALDLGYTVYQGQQVELEALSLPPGSRAPSGPLFPAHRPGASGTVRCDHRLRRPGALGGASCAESFRSED
jgi:hypothetical protein